MKPLLDCVNVLLPAIEVAYQVNTFEDRSLKSICRNDSNEGDCSMIHLEKITTENVLKVISLQVGSDQAAWVKPVSHALSLAFVHGKVAIPFAVYSLKEIVGFVMLRYHPQFNNYLLWQFLIDQEHQRKGYGTEALKCVVEWIQYNSDCNEIIVSYHEGNEVAGKLYRDFGFKDMNLNENGEVNLKLQW